jgi:uncharacterized protein
LEALELILLGGWSFAVAVAGGVAGLVLGNMRLPLVLALSSSPAAGAGANVGVSMIGALTSAGVHLRAGRLHRRLFWLMAPASLAGGVIGGLISGVLPKRVLLAGIAAVVLLGAVEVLRYGREREEARGRGTEPGDGGRPRAVAAAAVGFLVGVLGGIVGLILGTLRVPATIRWVGVNPAAAVGTNSAVGVLVGVGGLIGHLPSGVDWDLLAVAGAATIPGAYLGAQLVGRLDERALLRAIAAILAVAGAGLAVQAAVG